MMNNWDFTSGHVREKKDKKKESEMKAYPLFGSIKSMVFVNKNVVLSFSAHSQPNTKSISPVSSLLYFKLHSPVISANFIACN